MKTVLLALFLYKFDIKMRGLEGNVTAKLNEHRLHTYLGPPYELFLCSQIIEPTRNKRLNL